MDFDQRLCLDPDRIVASGGAAGDRHMGTWPPGGHQHALQRRLAADARVGDRQGDRSLRRAKSEVRYQESGVGRQESDAG